MKVCTGTIVDTMIINAPSSTWNRAGKRDPEMHQTKKGNQWCFSIKAHIGVDSRTRSIHPVASTAANAHDSQLLHQLLHGDETRARGDSTYTGQADVIHEQAPGAQDFTNKKGHRSRPLTVEDSAKSIVLQST
ncbi:MAG: IS4/IS5 family transposase [Proteobacteria bacterium]|nr:MAG: IS4/IS5 family transposase [Pseudomonadota bacterium]QKK11456.1 MAG: transposase [Pseudomonadota bacterium]